MTIGYNKTLQGILVLIGLCAVAEPVRSAAAVDCDSGECTGVVIDTRLGGSGQSARAAIIETRVGDFETVSPVSLKTLPHPGFAIIIR